VSRAFVVASGMAILYDEAMGAMASGREKSERLRLDPLPRQLHRSPDQANFLTPDNIDRFINRCG
jgi:hypothetical protein